MVSQPVAMEERERTIIDGAISRRLLTFTGFRGTRIPGYLFEPTAVRPGPAIVVVAGHGAGIVETAGLAPSYQHDVGLALARLGYVTFCPELRGFGYLGARIGNEHRVTAANALSAGSFYQSVLTADLRAAVTLVRRLPTVDSLRVGMTGVSLGGELSLLHAALDPRIAVVVVQGYTPPIGARNGSAVDSAGDVTAEHFGQIIPSANEHMRGEDMSLLIVPRPLLLVNGTDDRLATAPGGAYLQMMRRAYRLHGRLANFRIAVTPGEHEYVVEPARQFFDAHL